MFRKRSAQFERPFTSLHNYPGCGQACSHGTTGSRGFSDSVQKDIWEIEKHRASLENIRTRRSQVRTTPNQYPDWYRSESQAQQIKRTLERKDQIIREQDAEIKKLWQIVKSQEIALLTIKSAGAGSMQSNHSSPANSATLRSQQPVFQDNTQSSRRRPRAARSMERVMDGHDSSHNNINKSLSALRIEIEHLKREQRVLIQQKSEERILFRHDEKGVRGKNQGEQKRRQEFQNPQLMADWGTKSVMKKNGIKKMSRHCLKGTTC